MKKFILPVLFSLLIYPVYLSGQTDSASVFDLDLIQLSKLKITSVSKVSQKIDEIPSTVYVITKNEIKENGYFKLEDALATLPGFQFRNIVGMNTYSFQRGMPNQNNLTLLLINGIQINELNSGGFYGGAQYNLDNVERIEVIYGPSSVAYGTNALTGIINIVSKSPESNYRNLNTEVGMFNTIGNNFTISKSFEKSDFGFIASGMMKRSEKADLRGNNGDNNWTDLMENFENDYSFDLKLKYKNFTFGSNTIYKQASNTTLFRSVGTGFLDYGSSWNILFANQYLKYNKVISESFDYNFTLYNRNTTVMSNTIYAVYDTSQMGYYRPNNLTGIENILNYNRGEFFSITGGLTIEYESLAKKSTVTYSGSKNLKPPKPPRPEMADNYLASIFLEPRINLSEKLFLSGGIRFDKSSIYNNKLTPRLGLVYKPEKSLFRLSYSEGFRAPKAWDYTDGIGNSGLLPEKMKSFEGSAGFDLHSNFRFNLTAYYNSLTNAIKREVLQSGYRWVNTGEVNVTGFEFYTKYSKGDFKTTFSYTYNNSVDGNKAPIPEIAKNSANLNLRYSPERNLKINLRGEYLGKRLNVYKISATNSMYLDPYFVLNGAISLVDIMGFDFQLSAWNILDSEYYHSSNRDPERYRQPQRTLLMSIGYTFN